MAATQKTHVFAGDFDCKLLKHSENTQFQNLIDTMAPFGFIQIVSRPTRITENNATLTDHVYTNNLVNTLSCNIITTAINENSPR